MRTPFFSIIVPVFNVEKYLHRFLDSIVTQNFSDYEVLLIDDGSSDESGLICDDFCKFHLNFRTIHTKNGGVSSARNKGIDNACGRWLLFFDSDDIVLPGALFLIYSAIIEHPYTDTVIYPICEVQLDGSKRNLILPITTPSYFDKEKIRAEILPYFCQSSSFLNSPFSKAFKRSVVELHNVRFKKRVRGEDWLFCLEYFCNISSAVSIPNILYSYMRNEYSAMSKYCPEQFQLWEENWRSKCDLIENFHLSVDMMNMRREMLVKAYYFIQDAKIKEPKQRRSQKIRSILRSQLLNEWLDSKPANFREFIIKFRLKIDQLRFLAL